MWTKSIVICALFLVSGINSSPQIVGASNNITQYPFLASLRSYSSHICSASIINTRWLLTAAHCVHERNPEVLSVQYCVNDVSDSGPNVVPVKRYIKHKGLDPNKSTGANIALIELETPLNKTCDFENIAILIRDTDLEARTDPVVLKEIGWGYGVMSVHTSAVNAYLSDECGLNYICATAKNAEDFCGVDSAAVLLYGAKLQLGILTWTVDPIYPYPYTCVYTFLGPYVPWIANNTSEERSIK